MKDGLATAIAAATAIAVAITGATNASVALAAKEAALGATQEVARAIYVTAIAAATTAYDVASVGPDFSENGGINASPPATLTVNNTYNLREASSSTHGENECSCH